MALRSSFSAELIRGAQKHQLLGETLKHTKEDHYWLWLTHGHGLHNLVVRFVSMFGILQVWAVNFAQHGKLLEQLKL